MNRPRIAHPVGTLVALGGCLWLWLAFGNIDQDRSLNPVPSPLSTTTLRTVPERIHEGDDAFICSTMGNRVCGDGALVVIHGSVYEVSAPRRPGCFVEPNNRPAGYEVTEYDDISTRTDDLGFEVPCSN